MGRAGCCRRGAERLASPFAARRFRPLPLLIVALCCAANIGNTTQHITTQHNRITLSPPDTRHRNANRSFRLKVRVVRGAKLQQPSLRTFFFCFFFLSRAKLRTADSLLVHTEVVYICAAGSLCFGPHCCCCCCLTMALPPAAVQQPEPGSSFSSSLLGRHSPGCPLNGSWRRKRRRRRSEGEM